jgi:xylulokinase
MASHDTWCSVVGMGAMRAGSAYAICGTSDVAGAVADRPAAAPGLLAVPWGERLHQLGGPSSNGADVAPWLARLTGATDLDALLTAPRASRPALFLPYLSGERAPYWDADLRGAFLGLDRSHGPADLAWAVVEGSALWLADVIARAEAALGFAAPEVRIAGGGTRSAIWNQVRADALGKTIAVAADEPGLVGCAALAFVALGRFPDLDAAQKAMAAPAARFTPDPTRHAAYRTLAELHRRAVEAVGPLSRDLGQVALPPTTPPR